MNDGAIDWESVFEAENSGLIPLINKTRTRNGLRECLRVIITSIFRSKDDDESRVRFESVVKDLIPAPEAGLEDDAEAIAEKKRKLIDLLREIKQNRLKKAAESSREQGAAEAGEALGDPEPAAARVFTEICSEFIAARFAALRENIDQHDNAAGPLPFVLSAEFAERFDGVLRRHVFPDLAGRCRRFLVRVSQQPADQLREILENAFADRRDSAALCETWRESWRETVLPEELPPKPKDDGKKGLLAEFKKKKQPAFGRRELTLEEWQERVREIEAANKAKAEAWAEICAEGGAYLPPTEDDEPLLGELFVKSPEDISKQITALRQIAEQGGNLGKNFDAYLQGKNVNLAVLAVTYQRPDMFVVGQARDDEGEPQTGALRIMLKGYDDREKRERFGLAVRYLSDHF